MHYLKMGSVRLVRLMMAVAMATMVWTMPPPQQSTPRTPHQIGETIKVLTNQLMDANITSSDVVLDTRTPPRVKQQQQQKLQLQQTKRENVEDPVENSHPGIAVPIDDEALILDESNKKLHFYKIDKPTTDSGLSTWILLSGHTSSPTSAVKTSSRKPAIKQTGEDMTIVLTDTNKNLKPVFKKKPVTSTTAPTTTTTTEKPGNKKQSSSGPTLATKSTTAKPDKATKLTKVKASILNSAVNNKTKPYNLLVSSTSTKKPFIANATLSKTTPSALTTSSSSSSKTVELIKVSDSNAIKSNSLPIESKDDEMDLNALTTTTTNPKKSRRPGSKRKKNKNRRKRPSVDRTDDLMANSTKVATATNKEKPIGTQIYNYLSREVMPTVGVGLVGLMVTAGLASYFLYPFGALRRSYDIDRKDKDASSYLYRNEYNGGIAEEEAIGKVIAGMPSFSPHPQSSYTSKTTYPISNVLNSNVRYRQVDHRYSHPNPHHNEPQASIETVKINPDFNKKEEVVVQNMYVPQEAYNAHYNKEVMNDKNDDNKQFVVGNVPKEYLDDVTPIAVPEHGPRSLKLTRRRRRQVDYSENDIFADQPYGATVNDIPDAPATVTTMSLPVETTTTKKVAVQAPDKETSFLDLFKDILQLKIKMGLELLHNTTQTISKYISRIQKRVEDRTNRS